ncbi:MAG TPA: ribosome small subunit-dependent GTPase A [Vicinamibacteria bacterium]
MVGLRGWGWDEALEAAFAPHRAAGLEAARVVLEDKGRYRLQATDGERDAKLSGRLRHTAGSREELPAVGDWVTARLEEDAAAIHGLLPRRSRFVRKAAGQRTEPQVVAANVDVVFLVVALDRQDKPRLVERYLTMAWDSGARPVVLLNKADLATDAEARAAEIASGAPGVPVHAVSTRTAGGLDRLLDHLAPGRTAAFLGHSGVGKSTIVNRLLGTEAQPTGEVRAGDHRGRHTTVRRQLVVLPGGALVIDTPGMRELQLWDVGEGLAETFPDAAALAEECRFRDCSHAGEPGCALQQAVAEGRFPAGRLDSYLKLRRELEDLGGRQEGWALKAERQKLRSLHRLANRHKPRE